MKRCIALVAAAGIFCAFCSIASFSAPARPQPYIAAAIADSHRPKADTDRDQDRKPEAVLTYLGARPGSTVGEILPGGGYMTRLLSVVVGPEGHIYSINLPTLNDRMKAEFKGVTGNPAYANVSVSEQALSDLKLPELVDLILISLNYHDFKNSGMFNTDTALMNKAIYAALKPGGTYVVIDHAAAAGSGSRDTATLHRIDPAVVKKEVLAAGFKFVGQNNALAVPTDPHTEHSGDKTDKFVLKFRKPG